MAVQLPQLKQAEMSRRAELLHVGEQADVDERGHAPALLLERLVAEVAVVVGALDLAREP